MYRALVTAAQNRWSPNEELLAGLYELTHASHRVLLRLGGVKELPEALKVPRPGVAEKVKKAVKKASPSEFVGWMRDRERV